MRPSFPITESNFSNEINNNFHDRKTPSEDMLASVDQQDPVYSPTPGASVTSLSSPGSVTYTGHIGFPESQSMGSFYGQVSSCPSSSSLEVTTNFSRVNSTVSTSSEGLSRIMVPLSSNVSSLSPCRSSSTPELKQSSPKGNKPTVARRRSGGIKARKSVVDQCDDTTTHRRQKRLQRNRESARLSRRRRKVYLEELEERVNKLSEELDKTRREHIVVAVGTIRKKRVNILSHFGLKPATEVLTTIDKCLSRTSEEMMVSVTFMTEQLKSFFIPPSVKFIMWLTLQSDKYFRGGRASSERLSAARIGERMLTSGTDRATPSQQMWPLLCNEIGLSYDQEEKVRLFQKGVLQDHESWVDRHRVYASEKALASAHDSIQALALRTGQREYLSASILTAEQRARFLAWSTENRSRIEVQKHSEESNSFVSQKYEISKERHVAANLYVLNHRFECVLQKIPRAAPLITSTIRKKLAVRPSFESLGAQEEKCPDLPLSRENSFASSGSLQRNESEMSMESDEKLQTQMTPQEAQVAAQHRVDEALAHVKDIIPPSQLCLSSAPNSDSFGLNQNSATGAPPLSSTFPYNPESANFPNGFSFSQGFLPAPVSMSSMEPNPSNVCIEPDAHHERKSSFLPAHLNVVPEEMWPDGSDDFFMDLVADDWAIGEGIDMDHVS